MGRKLTLLAGLRAWQYVVKVILALFVGHRQKTIVHAENGVKA